MIKEFKNKKEMLNYPLLKEAFECVIDMTDEEINNMKFIDNKLKSDNDYLWVEEYPQENAEFIAVNGEIIYSNDYIDVNEFVK